MRSRDAFLLDCIRIVTAMQADNRLMTQQMSGNAGDDVQGVLATMHEDARLFIRHLSGTLSSSAASDRQAK